MVFTLYFASKEVYISVFVWVCAHEFRCFQRSELLSSPRAEVRGVDEPPDVGGRNQTCMSFRKAVCVLNS